MTSAGSPPVREVAHVTLRLGRLMLANGADTAHVHRAVVALAASLGYQAHLFVGAEGLLLTLENADGFRTRLGQTVSGMAVNMGVLVALDGLWQRSLGGTQDVSLIDRELDTIEKQAFRYPHWLVAIGMGVTAASLARLFGATWPVVGVSVMVGIVTQVLRQRLSALSAGPVVVAALAAFGGGLVGALAMRVFPEESPTLCLVAAGMILVPGVPLLNGVRDILSNHIGAALERLTLGTVMVLAISFSLFLAARLAGDRLPVDGNASLLPVPEDFLFSALAGLGYALLFNVPMRAAWACVLCATVGHGMRTAVEHFGLDLGASSFVAAFLAGFLARLLANRFRVPAVTFAFPGIVAMIPGAYAFRAGVGGLSIMHAGPAASPALVGETIALTVTAIVATTAVALGLCLALAAPFPKTPHPIAPAGDRS